MLFLGSAQQGVCAGGKILSWKKTIVGACIAGTVAAVVISNWNSILAQGDYLLSRVDGRYAEKLRIQSWYSDVGDIVVEMTAKEAEKLGIHGIDTLSFGFLINVEEEKFDNNRSHFISCDNIFEVILKGKDRGKIKEYYIYAKGTVEYDGSSFRNIDSWPSFVFISPNDDKGYAEIAYFCAKDGIILQR